LRQSHDRQAEGVRGAGSKASGPRFAFQAGHADVADGKRTKGNFSPVLFVLGETKTDSENGRKVMKKKAPIKVIKRDERSRQQKPAEGVAAERKSTQEAARDMVATVTQWVNEFQQKRRVETTRAIKTLFTDATPQTSKA
jgi:hypothetical protein